MSANPRIRECLNNIYEPGIAAETAARLDALLREHRPRLPAVSREELSERDALLIAYPDQVLDTDQAPLECLDAVCTRFLSGIINGLHILPFFPASSDDGFSVVDYRSVDSNLGEWRHIQQLRRRYNLMFDVVLNHVSVRSSWFEAFLRNESPYSEYFITIDGDPNLGAVARPRTSPVLTRFKARNGDRKVWTTFSADQADLEFHNPAVLLEILDLALFYVELGASFLRLDAIAYAWKEIGSACLHDPKVHWIVRLIRAVLESAAPHVRLLTETNVAQGDNLSYFGDGTNEAHLVYNFALPPLVLHTFHTENCTILADWAGSLAPPSPNASFLNILATHDGIGLNGARGILDPRQIEGLVQRAEASGAHVSRHSNADGSTSSYEINANFLDALEGQIEPADPGSTVQRFLAAHAILLALQGMPGLYFHSLFGSRGWPEGARRTGRPRSVNREKMNWASLTAELEDPETMRSQIFSGLGNLLRARRQSRGFAPRAEQRILKGNPAILTLLRSSADGDEKVLCMHNCSASPQTLARDAARAWAHSVEPPLDLVGGVPVGWPPSGDLTLRPYQTMWLRMMN
jgi:sucrose phosphorylase